MLIARALGLVRFPEGSNASAFESVYGILLLLYVVIDLCEGRKLTFFEEKPDLVATGKEIVIPNMVAALTRGELGHGVLGKRKVLEHGVSFLKERGDGVRGECVWDEEVAVSFKSR